MRNFHVTRILQPKLGLELLDKSDCLAVLLIGTENRFFIGFFLNKSAIRQFVKKNNFILWTSCPRQTLTVYTGCPKKNRDLCSGVILGP